MSGGQQTADVYCALLTAIRNGQRTIGACIRRRIPRVNEEDAIQWALELYDFLDNDQYSNLDCFLVQVGACVILVPEDLGDLTKADNRKMMCIFENRPQVVVERVKRQLFKRTDSSDIVRKLVAKENHETAVAEVKILFPSCAVYLLSTILQVERPMGYQCMGCLALYLKLNDIDSDFGAYELRFGSLSSFMRLDSAAVEAVNLLPRPDHPSPLGSIYGVLNRCKTKMGHRLLER